MPIPEILYGNLWSRHLVPRQDVCPRKVSHGKGVVMKKLHSSKINTSTHALPQWLRGQETITGRSAVLAKWGGLL